MKLWGVDMTHNPSVLLRREDSFADCLFDVPGLGLTRIADWLDKYFTAPDKSRGLCVSVRSQTIGNEIKVELGLRMDGGALQFLPITDATRESMQRRT